MQSAARAKGQTRRRQVGAAAVEFALVALFFFTLLFGIMEFGRLLFLHNAVQEVTRYAAREAVVRAPTEAQRVLIRGDAALRLLGGAQIAASNVRIRYLNANQVVIRENQLPGSAEANVILCAATPPANNCIMYVEASVWDVDANQPVRYSPMVPYFDSILNVEIPPATVVMPAESLGLLCDGVC